MGIDWKDKRYSLEFIEKYYEEYSKQEYPENELNSILAYQYVTEDFVVKWCNRDSFLTAVKFQELSEKTLEYIINQCECRYEKLLSYIVTYQHVSEEFIEQWIWPYECLNADFWLSISKYQSISKEFIAKYKDKLNFDALFNRGMLDDDMIIEYMDKLDFNFLIRVTRQNFSDRVLLACCDKIDWEVASNFIPLSEDVIDAVQDKVDWQTICAKQKISNKFLLEHIDKLDDMCLLYLKNNSYYKEEQVKILKLSGQVVAKKDTDRSLYWIRENKLGYEEVLGTIIRTKTFKDAVKQWILAYDEYDEYVSKGKLLLNTKLIVTKLNSQNFKTKTYVVKTSNGQIDIIRLKTEKEGAK